jgi:hypothetical protein
MDRVNFYDFAGLFTTAAGRLYSTHVGDDLQWSGFQEGANPPADQIAARSQHPLFGPSVQLAGVAIFAVAILYMDHRIKVKL